MAAQKSVLKVVMGAMTFGKMDSAQVNSVEKVKSILGVFKTHGHFEIDTARVYNGGTSEELLGEADSPDSGFKFASKLWPSEANPHTLESLHRNIHIALKSLKLKQLDIWYLHAADKATPFKDTLAAIDQLHKEGLFLRFGISNFKPEEVTEVVDICKKNNYVLPSVYQGGYSAVQRNLEPQIMPCLREHGISFYQYNPLAGGFFTSKYSSVNDEVEPGSRFDPATERGKIYRMLYWNDGYFEALAKIKEVAEKHGLSTTEIALRWTSHHSMMKPEYGDAVVIGASNVDHITENLRDLEKGPLPNEVVTVLEQAWVDVEPFSFKWQ